MERNPMGKNNVQEPWSEPRLFDLLTPLAFGASLEELATFLIDNIVDAEPRLNLDTARDRALIEFAAR
jgi:hypothetical protein